MSYGNRNINHGMHGNSRSGLLGAGPSPSRRGAAPSPQNAMRRDHTKSGLLGNVPNYQEEEDDYKRSESYSNRRENSFADPYEEQPYKREPQGGDRYPQRTPPMPNNDRSRLPVKTQRIMENFGLTSSDLEELSQLPENKLSATNFIEMVKAVKQRKLANAQSSSHQSFDDRYERSDSSEGYGDASRYPEEGRQEDALSSFQEKWYSDTSKKNERDQQQQPSGSILRASRGPMVNTSRWERDERPSEDHLRRSSPRRMEPRRMSPSPQRRASPILMSRRMSPPPVRRMSPPRRPSPPPLRRHGSPPVRMPQGLSGRGGLLGDPRDPSTQELDMLASSRPQANFRNAREFPEPPRRNEPQMRSRTPPPLMSQVINVKRKEPVPVHRPARPGPPRPGPPPIPRKQGPPPAMAKEKVLPNSDLSFPKAHAVSEANIMRREKGRVLYLRYQAGSMGRIREEHLVKLAQPFEKVTNILLMAPQNLASGWYQAFIELADFDGAAAMLEHYMTRPPSVDGVTLMVQKAKYRTLQLRKDQMNRDFDHLLGTKSEPKRRKAMSLSPERGRKRMKPRRDSSREETPKKKAFMKPTTPNKGNKRNATPKREKTLQDKKEEEKPKIIEEKMESHSPKKGKKSEKPKEDAKKEVPAEPETLSKKESEPENVKVNGELSLVSKLKDEKNKERLEIIRDNLDQATTMSEELLPLIKEESMKEILSEVMEYIADSTSQLKELEETLQKET